MSHHETKHCLFGRNTIKISVLLWLNRFRSSRMFILPSNPVETSNKFPMIGNGAGPGTFEMSCSTRRRRSL